MNFTLFYSGPIRSGNSKDIRHINDIRLSISPQIRRLYECEPLKSHKVNCEPGSSDGYFKTYVNVEERSYSALVNPSIEAVCQLSVTFFEAEGTLSVASQIGDVDNKTKTLLDALRLPQKTDIPKIPHSQETIHCLLFDDALLWGVDIKRRRLLDSSLGNGKTFTQIDVQILPRAILSDSVGLFGVPVF
jgi:hypothetical protein